MAFSAAYTSATTSSTFNPTKAVSEYIIEGTFKGTVRLQFSIPDADSWKDLVIVSHEQSKAEVCAGAINTPDILVDYRVVATGITGTANIYFGP